MVGALKKSPAGVSTSGAFALFLCQAAPSSINTMIKLTGTPNNQSRIGMADSCCADCAV